MKNAILQICQRLRGYSSDTEYFDVVKVSKLENGNYEVEVQVVDPGEGLVVAENEILV